jgi:hypothetical protein
MIAQLRTSTWFAYAAAGAGISALVAISVAGLAGGEAVDVALWASCASVLFGGFYLVLRNSDG